MKETLQKLRKDNDAQYMQDMVLELGKVKRERIGPGYDPSLTYEERMAKSLAMQPASTKRLLMMTDEEHAEHMKRPVPTWEQALAVKGALNEDGTIDMDKAVAARPITAQEVAVVEDIRRKGRNSQGDAVSYGASAFTSERREAAVDAFIYTPPAELTPAQKTKLTEMNKITEYTGPVPEVKPIKKKSWWQKLFADDKNSPLPPPMSLAEKLELINGKK